MCVVDGRNANAIVIRSVCIKLNNESDRAAGDKWTRLIETYALRSPAIILKMHVTAREFARCILIDSNRTDTERQQREKLMPVDLVSRAMH